MAKIDYVYTLQRGSSSQYRTTDENRWLVLKEAWSGNRLLSQRMVFWTYDRVEAVAERNRLQREANCG